MTGTPKILRSSPHPAQGARSAPQRHLFPAIPQSLPIHPHKSPSIFLEHQRFNSPKSPNGDKKEFPHGASHHRTSIQRGAPTLLAASGTPHPPAPTRLNFSHPPPLIFTLMKTRTLRSISRFPAASPGGSISPNGESDPHRFFQKANDLTPHFPKWGCFSPSPKTLYPKSGVDSLRMSDF